MPHQESEQVVIASSYFKNWEQVIQASEIFTRLGKTVYPHNRAGTEEMMTGFLRVTGVDEHIRDDAKKLERAFLERAKKAELFYVVTGGGYIGESTSAETAYIMARGLPILMSEPVTKVSVKVPESVEDIILKYFPPVLPIHQIEERFEDIFSGNLHESLPTLHEREVWATMHAVRKLQRGWKS